MKSSGKRLPYRPRDEALAELVQHAYLRMRLKQVEISQLMRISQSTVSRLVSDKAWIGKQHA
jgi:predicted XRE-type DNA-binding protein